MGTSIVQGLGMLAEGAKDPTSTENSTSKTISMPTQSTMAIRHTLETWTTLRSCRHPTRSIDQESKDQRVKCLSSRYESQKPRLSPRHPVTLGSKRMGSMQDSMIHKHRACRAIQPCHHSHTITYTRPKHHQANHVMTCHKACQKHKEASEWHRVHTAWHEKLKRPKSCCNHVLQLRGSKAM